jgi:hypothetical protein
MSRLKDSEDYIVCFIGDKAFTAKDLGDELLDMDLRVVFQEIIDRGMVPGLEPGTPWFEHIRMDGMERWDNEDVKNTTLIESLIEERKAAEKELLETYTPEARERLAEAHRRVRMAKKLVSD